MVIESMTYMAYIPSQSRHLRHYGGWVDTKGCVREWRRAWRPSAGQRRMYSVRVGG